MGLLVNCTIALVELLLLVLTLAAAAAAPPPAAPRPAHPKPDCLNSCGNISIPYPFGLSKDCCYDANFLIGCSNTTKKPFLPKSNSSVVDILIEGQLRVSSSFVYVCYNNQGNLSNNYQQFNFSPFTVSDSSNKLTGVGCDSLTLIQKEGDFSNAVCISVCDDVKKIKNASCAGTGCCQSPIPKGMNDFEIDALYNVFNTNLSKFSPCTYAFIAEEGKYNFSSLDLLDLRNSKEIPMILDWSIGNMTCKEAQENRETYACKENGECSDSINGAGYLCKCSKGYQGNPYLTDGCQDVNECADPDLNQCIENEYCHNTIGNYTCSCPKGQHGDGRKDGQGCLDDNSVPVMIILGISLGLLVLLLAVSWLYFGLRKRKLIKLKEKYFKENGGYLLQQRLSEHDQSSIKPAQIFTEKDLKKATNNFHESRILGKGGQGTVYKGVLSDNQVVAVKKSRIGDETQVEGFINEVTILSQINHRNVVKLLGCCLETQVPLLVYEFVTNGTLFDHIHCYDNDGKTLIPWETRLKIAIEVAEALSYMHSAASTPIIHRDIKSANILLDENYTAKVSDFGASKLIPLNKNELTTLVQGTFGYLDPEYMHTSQLTGKSDVYSFGVVLAELLTRKKAISLASREEERNLATHFVTSLQENRLLEILDHQLVNEKNIDQLKAVAMLARSCLNIKGEERPTMKDVVVELRGLCSLEKHPWEKGDFNAQEYHNPVETSFKSFPDCSNSITVENESIMKSTAFEIGSGR